MSIKPPKLIRRSPIRTFFSLMLLCLSVPRIFGQETTWEIVAGISASDRISIIHVNNLLSSKGIDHIIEGSVVYGISVHPPYARQVERLLRKDAKNHGYCILFGKDDYVEAKKGPVRQIGKPISALLAEREFATDTALGKLLRSDTLSEKLKRYPFVVSLEIRKRSYLASEEKVETGYDVGIVLHEKSDDDLSGYQVSFQIWANGDRIAFRGSNGWRQGRQ